jgi:hypothetical protein
MGRLRALSLLALVGFAGACAFELADLQPVPDAALNDATTEDVVGTAPGDSTVPPPDAGLTLRGTLAYSRVTNIGHDDQTPDNNTLVLLPLGNASTPPKDISRPTDQDEGAAWSPDGTLIAFEIATPDNNDVWIMNADGTGRRNLCRNCDKPTFGPGGDVWVVTLADADSASPYNELAHIPPGGGSLTLWPGNAAGCDIENYNFSPDNKTIAYNVKSNAPPCDGDQTGLLLAPVDGVATAELDGAVVPAGTIVPNPGVGDIDWIQFNNAGDRLFFSVGLMGGQLENKLYSLKLDGSDLRIELDLGIKEVYDGRYTLTKDNILFACIKASDAPDDSQMSIKAFPLGGGTPITIVPTLSDYEGLAWHP